MDYKKFRVPGKDIRVRSQELLVINTPSFQRLFNIKQMGLANLVYPFATHTRAAHCLDCMDMAQRFLDALVVNLEREDRTEEAEAVHGEEELVRMSAVLHDIMHIPYAHTLEDENGILKKGDEGDRIDKTVDMVEKQVPKPQPSELGALGVPSKEDYDKVKDLLPDVRKVLWTIASHGETDSPNKETLEPERYYIADIIGNTISADLLSYIVRDVDYTGIEKRPGASYRIFDYLTLAEDKKGRTRLAITLTKGGLRHDVISAILGVLDVRYALTETVIYHHAKCAASAMLGKAAWLCNLKESDALYSIGDEGLLRLLAETEQKDTEAKNAANRLLEGLKARRFHKRVFKVTMAARGPYDTAHTKPLPNRLKSPADRAKIEREIELDLALPMGSIILFCPSPKMALKEASVLVTYHKVDGVRSSSVNVGVELNGSEFRADYPDVFKRVSNVQDQYLALWTLYAFLDPAKFLYAAAIQERLTEKLGVTNDPQFQLYLDQKKEYALGKRLAEEGQRQNLPETRYYLEEARKIAATGAPGAEDEWSDKLVERIVRTARERSLLEPNTEKDQVPKGPETLFPLENLEEKDSE